MDERRTAERILEAAEVIFAERGYDGASLGEVADRVGIRGPSLYNHFKNKRELYTAVLERLLDPFFALLDELVARPPSPERDADSLAAMVFHHASNPNLARLIGQAALAGGDRLDLLVDRWYRPFFARASRLIPSGGGEPDEPLAAVLMGFNSLILGYFTLAPLHARLFGKDPLASAAVERYVDFLSNLETQLGADD